MDESLSSQIIAYKSVIADIDDFIDYLISINLLNENAYLDVWKRRPQDRLNELFNKIPLNGSSEAVLKYLKENYPHHEKELENERNYRIASVRGSFPELPPYYVSRKTLVDEVKFKLQDLKWDQKLVIHGMMGYGKSCLIHDVLKDAKVREYFDNYLFWVNLGDCHSKEDVWQPMWRLYTAASSIIETKTSHCLDDVDGLKNLLKKLFLEDRLKNSLIILDDASKTEVLTFFDIKAKTVITTQNRSILVGRNVTFVEVKTGFSSKESLELFKKSLDVKHDLPVAAEEIHHICRGHPMRISLIGSYLNENAEEALHGDHIWQYIIDQFLNGQYELNEYTNPQDFHGIIDKCIETLLTDDLKELYKDLSIFEQDVNIPPEVLQILWNKTSDQVRNIMSTLAGKSLVVRFFHTGLNIYIYGIHDVYLSYLKEETKGNRKYLHRKLLEGYDKITNCDYTKLPDDNYTLQFIGYHMYHGEEFHKFKEFLNLNFLELKIKAVGTEDVLRDMYKYRKYITRNENHLKEKLRQYNDFIKRCGKQLYSYMQTNIVQFALKENKDSYVFKDAINIAKKSPHLFFQLQKSCEELDLIQNIPIKDDIHSACYVDSPNHILIGTVKGKIKLFYERSVTEISNFVGHAGAITNLIISPDKRYFLSISIDSTIMLWKFAPDSSRNSRDFSNGFERGLIEAVVSPKNKQKNWLDIHTADGGQIKPSKTFKAEDSDDALISAAFHTEFPDKFRIATASKKGKVFIWDAYPEKPALLYSTAPRGFPVPSLLYSDVAGKESVIFSCDDTIYVLSVKNDRLQYQDTLLNGDQCNSIFFYDSKYIVVGEKTITMFGNRENRYKKKVIFENEEVQTNVCSTLTNDNQYLVVSTDQNFVYIWDLDQERILREFENKGLAKSMDTFYDDDRSVHLLLISSDKRSLQQCHIQPYEREPQVDIPIFTPYWKKKTAMTATSTNDQKLQIFAGYILISESEPASSQITCTCFSVSGNDVIYGLKNGEIRRFNIRFKFDTMLEAGTSVPVTYLKCFDPSNSYSYGRSSVSSGGSTDTLDYLDTELGVIVAMYGNDNITILNKGETFKTTLSHPSIYPFSDKLLIIDSACNIYTWHLETGYLISITNKHILEPVTFNVGAFSPHKSLIAALFDQLGTHFCHIYYLDVETDSVRLLKRFRFTEKMTTAKFSCDGSLLAIGMASGSIKVYNLDENYKETVLNLHEDPIQDLIFSPHKEPILVSMGEEIAWWNLRPLQKNERKGRKRPNSIDILEGLSSDFSSMDITFWSERQPVKGSPYLLSIINLTDKVKYMSASNDFNSFLTIDVTGKVHIMDIILPACEDL
ncbi:apoptotic protease-activating factor 1-like isoform X2 [Diabrotica virgifera virgifera]|uniref:Apoptotic protease-activating factor 1 n=1 Tax=Diabrotica virgifera virgifera TaxID=50390 RepID=A0ABM5JR15_DIAVI|nr:apoptotic protease-activating factor 1-like isoform X2 [Diabrotica virgifera virgifera]